MNVTLEQVALLNKRIGDTVYSVNSSTGKLEAAPTTRTYIREHHLDDMIDDRGRLTDRAIRFAKEILS
jgi:hypothetical protein